MLIDTAYLGYKTQQSITAFHITAFHITAWNARGCASISDDEAICPACPGIRYPRDQERPKQDCQHGDAWRRSLLPVLIYLERLYKSAVRVVIEIEKLR